MRSKVTFFLLIFVGLLLQSFTPLAQEDTLKVVASQSILADVARNVAGDHVEVSALMPVGADPHTFIPSPSDLAAVANADLVLLVGMGYEELLLDAIVNAGETVNMVVASACVEILPYGASVYSEDEHMHEHEDEHADEHEDEHAHEHDEDEHADEHEDEHADEHEDEHADEHADEHDEDEHADEHDEDEHAHEHDEDEHAHEHDEDEHAHEHDEMGMAPDCDAYDAEFEAVMGEEADHDHDHVETLGRASEIDCGGGHDHGDEDDHHLHGEGSCDPHLWMDPHNVIYWVLMIRDSLSELDPDHADNYAANADAYIQELVALQSEFILPTLAELPAENRILVTGHETLGYFAAVFDFELVTTIVPLSETLVEPSAREVADLIDRVRDAGVAAVFGDTYSPGRVLEVIAAETGVKIAGLYSDTLSDSDGPAATYLDYMRYNVSTIVEALKP